MTSKFWCRAIHSPATSFWNSARSRPRGALWSMSSTIADWRRLAALRRRSRRLFSLDRLAIDHHGETLLEGERGDIGLTALVFERLSHAGEPECDKAIMGGMGQHRFLLSLVVVATAADVAVPDRRAFRWLPLAVGPVEAMLEDRGDGAVAASAVVVAAPAGGIEPLDAISLGEPQNAEAGAEPLLGMRLRPRDCLEQSER